MLLNVGMCFVVVHSVKKGFVIIAVTLMDLWLKQFVIDVVQNLESCICSLCGIK